MQAPGKIMRYVAVADMTADSHRFKTKEQLIAEGFEPDVWPPCDWCFIDAYDLADPQPAMGNRIRPRQGNPFGEWMLYEDPTARRQYRANETEWEAICPIHWYMAWLITAPACGWCGENPGRVCAECHDEYISSLFGDYQPETDCGCAWHNVFAERQPCWKPEERKLNPIRGSAQMRPVTDAVGQGVLI